MERCIYFFVIGAFSGWVLELTFKLLSNNMQNTPGILFGPFCILYGVGAVFLSLVIPKITSSGIWQFVLSFVILTTIEYITYVLLKNIYGISLWDYSTMPLKLDEKVCIEFSVIWGILGVIYIRYALPVLSTVYDRFNTNVLRFAIWFSIIYISLDFIVSSYILLRQKVIT